MEQQITVRNARKAEISGAEWLLTETPEGWIVKCNGATLVTEHQKRPRTFIDLNRAISRLKEEIGIRSFRLEAMQ